MANRSSKKWIIVISILVILASIGIILFFFLPKLINQDSSQTKLPFLQTKGKDIIAATGEKVFLRGVNFGGWLLWEGGVYGLPNFPEHQLDRMMEERMDRDKVDLFFELIKENFILSEDPGRVKALEFNFTRLPFHHRYVQENKLTKLDETIKWAKEHGVYIILDMHAAPGSQNTDYHSDSDGRAYLWENPDYQEKFIQLWEILAKRYKDESAVAGYEILNEPATDDKKLADLYERAISRIRKIDSHHIILLDGNNYASKFSLFDHSFGDNIIYVFHSYAKPEEMQQVVRDSGYLDFQKKYQVPLMCNEFDYNSVTSFFESNDIHWALWTYKSPNEAPPFYSLPPGHPWLQWLEKIGTESKVNKEEIKKQWLAVIKKSALSEEAKQELTKSESFEKDMFRDLARKYPEDAQELKRVYSELQKIVSSYEIDALTASLQSMNKNEMTDLIQSLQTKYWKNNR